MRRIRPQYIRSGAHFPQLFRSGYQRMLLNQLSSHAVGEELNSYGAGGFHPVSLGDTFDAGRYRILRKLGYGQYSTVWLARDFKSQRYVAIKALRADCYGGSERDILSKIMDISKRSKHTGRYFVLRALDQFIHTGPNGDHAFFVFDVLGHHLYHQCSKYEDGRLPVGVVKTIARQLLLGLDFLHNECDIIHTADIHPKNILVALENSDTAISRHLLEVPPRTDTQSGAELPLREIIKTPLIAEMKEPVIKIIDFGLATWRHKYLTHLIQSPALRAPEVTIGAPWDTKVDIWTLGCLIMEFIQGIILFSGKASEDGSWTADDDRLARTIEALGPFPTEFLEKGTRTADFFCETGDLRRIPNLKPTSFESLINGPTKPFLKPDDMPDSEVPIFIDFLKGMLTINPDFRLSAADLLQHEWLKL
ncbi:hypothetical protein PAAG_00884 [Paracoccidioides lutzii Pb01]|uniref:non-specific serine/threonine protein kinase n=1 Tax=Paracoccidioides lutzii (strain ATCC MYA-826 / Pb01) TaxID=502779 RepID=C1GQT9_PARBA|nr:hypothetical protein PAAG_00884 [Paracoccidioides lutzii Pb01]EEH37963.2 hypothetical protein PAAG_00884 [Paracoccidioides lutzii Pb01]